MNFLSVFAFRGTSLLISLLLNVILARLFLKDEIGIYFFFLQILTVSSLLLRYGSDNSLLKCSQRFSQETKVKAFIYSLKKSLIIFFIGTFSVFLYVYFFGVSKQYNKEFSLFYIFVFVFPYAFIFYVGEYLKGINKQNESILLQVFITPFIMIIGVYLLHLALIISFTISVIISFLFALYFYKSNHHPKNITNNSLVEYKINLRPFFYVSILNVIISTLDTILIGLLVDMSSVSGYMLASKLVALSSIFLVVVNGIVGPVFSRLWHEYNMENIRAYYWKVTKWLFAISIFLLVCFITFGEWGLVFLYGEPYRSSYSTLIILAVGQSVVLSTGPVAYLLMMTGETRYHLSSLYMAVILNVILNLLLVPLYGVFGAAISTATSLAIKNVYSFSIANKKFGLMRK
jgi:O-antigen/teichoic acid export membrane protein